MRFPPSKKEKRIPLSAASDEIKMDKIIQGPALSPWKDSCINSPNTSVAQFLKSSPDTTKPVLLDDSVSRQRVRGEKRRKQALVPHGQELFSKRRCSASRRGFSPNFPAGWMFDKATKGYSPTVGTSLLTYSPRLFEDLILEKPSDVDTNVSGLLPQNRKNSPDNCSVGELFESLAHENLQKGCETMTSVQTELLLEKLRSEQGW
mmetsp:Transcript_2302/g.4376  ORF Transcript_2302/g.4376 Transcript_2302/m.4376 type:complete len:205 (+) Transcript_2302:1218-1832(+)